MSSGISISSHTDAPLDLTVKRFEMDDSNSADSQKPFTTAFSSLDSQAGYALYQNNPDGYYENAEPYGSSYNTNVTSGTYSDDVNATAPSAQHLYISTSTYSAQQSPVYDMSPESYEHMCNNSSILPKKRKNLWRPYDSRVNQGLLPLSDREMDSGSDSGSNSSSDLEFKTPQPPMDPMKRRKRNMIRFAEENLDLTDDKNSKQIKCSSSQSKMETSMPASYLDVSMPSTSTGGKDFPTNREKMDSSESRDNIVSGIKSDVFGWSLKLMQPLEDIKKEGTENPSVCQDGEKTYFELQTVKKQSPSPPGSASLSSPDIPVKVGNAKYTPPKMNSSRSPPNSQGKRSKKYPSEAEKENVKTSPNSRVFIQHKDNVIESCDETQNVPRKDETKKTLSLIDLIQDIERDARKQDKDEAEKTKERNRGIVKLLEQCNHVKLQALDYLMSNVIIQERGPTFKSKNETIQKMLNGDKIKSVNMLDIVELQVEMGLN